MYTVDRPLDRAAFVAALRSATHDRLVSATEQWGARRVERLILQFRFEVLLGEQADEVLMQHRVCTSGEQRELDRALVEGCLRRG